MPSLSLFVPARLFTRRLLPLHGLLALVLMFLSSAGTRAQGAVNQDINGDGRVDAVFTQKQRFNQVCFGTGSGAFTTCQDVMGAGLFTLTNQINTTGAALVDWDNDGDLDIIFSMEVHSPVVCYNNGGGDFNSGLGCVELYGFNSFPYNSEGVAVGDFDGDGAPDVVFANGGNAGLPLNQPNVICSGFNTGAAVCREFGTAAPSTGVAVADLDNDSDLDVIVSNNGTKNEVCLNTGHGSNGVNFDCRLITPGSGVLDTKVSNGVAVGNMALGAGAVPDTLADVAFANNGKNEVCYGNGDWSGTNAGFTCYGMNTVSQTQTFNDANAQSVKVAIGDFMQFSFTPGDEIVFANLDAPNVRCFTGFTCTFNFQSTDAATGLPVIEASTGVAIRDINIDGKKDVFIANDPTSRTFLGAYFSGTESVVANGALHPSNVVLSGGTVGPPAVDNVPPQIFGAANKTAEATGPNGATVTFTVTAADLVDGAITPTCAPASGSTFGLGSTTVTCTATDKANNTGTATFSVNVVDTTGPTVTVPANITLTAPVGQATMNVPFTVSIVDLVDGVMTPSCYDVAGGTFVSSGSAFGTGTVTVTCSAYDAHHNYGENSFTITVNTDIDNDGISDVIDPDDDGDGILDTVDEERTVVSNSYRLNSTVLGTVTRNGWTVNIAPAAAPAPGQPTYDMHATATGSGTGTAIITANCSGLPKEIRLDANNESVDWTCVGGSLKVRFITGTPEFWKFSCTSGKCAVVKISSLVAPSVVTAGSPVVADPSNTAPISVTIYDENLAPIGSFTLDPEESVDVSIVAGPNNEPLLQLTVLNGGTDGTVTVELLGQTLNLASGAGPQTYDMHPDTTAPVVAAQVSGVLGNNGFYTSDVAVTWSVTDPESAVTSSGCGTQTVQFDTTGTTFTCTANSKGGTTTESVTIKRDATAPTISGSRTPGANGAGWNNGPVAVTFACNDAGSGVASCNGSTTLSTDGAGQSVTGTVTDLAGNTATTTVSGINIDSTAPAITVPAGITKVATSTAGAVVTYTASAQDALDPSPTFACTPASGSTFAIGATTVACTASDVAGNTSTKSFTVTVTAVAVSTPGRMEGEGFIRANNKRYEFKFDVRESSRGEQGTLRLTVKDETRGKDREKDKDRADTFVARTVSSVVFSDDPGVQPGRNRRPQIDTVLFSGVGSWNGVAGYTYEVFAQDAGEPGRHQESVRITIRNSSGAIVASVDGVLNGGNIQSARIRH